MFANANLAVPNSDPTHQDKPSPTPGNIPDKSNYAEHTDNLPAPASDDEENNPANSTANNPNSSGTDSKTSTNEGGSVTPAPSPEPQGNEGGNNSTGSLDITVTPTPVPRKNMLNVLFLGIDRTEAREETRISAAADTIMLARVDLDNKTMKVLAIPRDTYGYIPVADKLDKINSAYAYGAQQGKAIWSIKDAIKRLLGEGGRIDYYFTLDMEPIPDIIDDLGGVEVDVELDMQSHGVNLSKGMQVLDGKSSYDYIRWRYGGDGDIGRIRRQQGFIKAMFKKLQASEMEKELLRIILTYGDDINTDLGLEQLESIIRLGAEMNQQDIQFFVLPGEGKTMDDTSYWMINEEKAMQMLEDFYR